jgi:hypothetical protein
MVAKDWDNIKTEGTKTNSLLQQKDRRQSDPKVQTGR